MDGCGARYRCASAYFPRAREEEDDVALWFSVGVGDMYAENAGCVEEMADDKVRTLQIL